MQPHPEITNATLASLAEWANATFSITCHGTFWVAYVSPGDGRSYGAIPAPTPSEAIDAAMNAMTVERELARAA